MLKSLKVENIALIQEQYIEFYDNLNVLSGETGAGKSIIINALCFALGSRADKTLIRNGTDYAKVTATFEVQLNEKIKETLNELDIEQEETIIIMRKMYVDGKSEIKVNGMQVTLSMLKKLTSLLVDIYGQFEHANLLDEKKHLSVLDDFGGQEIIAKIEAYKEEYDNLLNLEKELKQLGGDERERATKIDFLQYQINEINLVNPQINEDEELEIQRTRMANAEKLVEAYNMSKNALDGDEYSARLAIATARNKLMANISLDPSLQELTNRLFSLEAELDDIASELNSLGSQCDYDEQAFNEVDERLDSIKMLKKKYGNTIEEIILSKDKAQQELDNLLNSAQLIEELNVKIEQSKEKLNRLGNDLTLTRQKYAKILEKDIFTQLSELGMAKSQFVVDFKVSEPTPNGQDYVEFMFSANLGEPVKNLNKIISGGELSRFMLALKTSLARTNNIGCQIYDEIDAGISGHIGQVISQKLSRIARTSQVITISHLPQIVAMADTHFKIEKFEQDGKTHTQITKQDSQESLSEIARLSGGQNIGSHAIELAKEMKSWADNYKRG